jgi:serine phosphatase RsbU (regulator of sigma subunit)
MQALFDTKPPAFLSYARKDSAFALRLAEDLKAAGANVWLDQLDIRPGQLWDREVEQALAACSEMLVVLSPASVVSSGVMDEVAFALEERKTVIPIIHEDCNIPLRLRRPQRVDFRPDYALGLKTLMRALTTEHRGDGREQADIERSIAHDLEQAAAIKRSFLPGSAPQVAGADLAGYNATCLTVGGDYYDFFTYPNGRVAMVLGDISGRGMPASLMMAGLQARVQVLAEEPQNLAGVMNRLNKITCQNTPSNRFITFFFCVLDPATGELAYCNAGHNPPVIVRADGATEYLDGGGPVLGILPAATYAEYRVKLERRDVLAIHSDGVTGAHNSAGEEFGDERFAAVLAANRHKSAAEIVAAVTQALTDFAAGSPQADDITLVVARRVNAAA